MTTQIMSPPPPPLPQTQSLPSSPRVTTDTTFQRPPRLGAKQMPSSSFDRSPFSTHPQPQPPRLPGPLSQPQTITSYSTSPAAASQKPNYNISLSDLSAARSNTIAAPPSYTASNYTLSTTIISSHAMSSPPLQSSPLSMTSLMAPMQPTRVVAAPKPVTKDDWSDFDPLR